MRLSIPSPFVDARSILATGGTQLPSPRRPAQPQPLVEEGELRYNWLDPHARLGESLGRQKKDVRTINGYIRNLVVEGELQPEAVVRNFRIA